jgi:hypothetical protein
MENIEINKVSDNEMEVIKIIPVAESIKNFLF